MGNVSAIIAQLKNERERIEKQLTGLNAALTAFGGTYNRNGKTRQISVAGKKRIAAAQRARWAKTRGEAEAVPKRTMSAASRRKIAAAQRARWTKVRKSNA
jgi:Skp family chaperone for outer membrane proteins